jgi:hypothetical protein
MAMLDQPVMCCLSVARKLAGWHQQYMVQVNHGLFLLEFYCIMRKDFILLHLKCQISCKILYCK